MKIDVKKLAGILFEEFERDGWGDIDPILFGIVADGNTHGEDRDEEDRDEDQEEDAQGMEKVLGRVIGRLEKL